MLDDTKLDSKLEELSRELMSRPVVPGYSIAETFATCGLDESGKPGLFTAVLLAPGSDPDLGVISELRQIITARLKQIDTRTPAWPIVVQGSPEIIDDESTVPGGREYFQQVKEELTVRRNRLLALRPRSTFVAEKTVPAHPTTIVTAKPRVVIGPKPPRAPVAAAQSGQRTAKRTAARTARTRS